MAEVSNHEDQTDRRLMERALELAARGQGKTSPNPMVGAVLVQGENRVIGEGWHQKAGEPHAEILAMEDARNQGYSLGGSTLYVTLEPCSTQDRRARVGDSEGRDRPGGLCGNGPQPGASGQRAGASEARRRRGTERDIGGGFTESQPGFQPLDCEQDAVSDAQKRDVARREDRDGFRGIAMDYRHGGAGARNAVSLAGGCDCHGSQYGDRR